MNTGSELHSPTVAAVEAQPGTWEWPDRPGLQHRLALFALVAATYGLGSQLALMLIEASGLQSVFFIPAGLTVAYLLRVSRRSWWVVVLAAGVTELFMDIGSGYAIAQSIGFAAANVVEPLLGAAIVTATCGAVDLARRRHVLWFTLGAVLAGPLLGALVGAWTDRFLGGDDFVETLFQWWIGDSLGVILVGSGILVWGSGRDRRPLLSPWGALLLAGTIASTVAVLTLSPLPLMFLVSVGVVLAAALFGVRATAVTSLAVATTIAAVLVLTSDWERLVFGMTTASALLLMKIQLGTFALTGLLIAAESNERALATGNSARLAIEAEAIESERRREQALAIQVQRGLLPDQLYEPPGVEIGARYEAAADALEVGGDWYDTIRLDDHRIGLVVGDIMGHGIEAMTSMGRLRTAVAALAVHSESPAELLERIDDFVASPDGAGYATMFYAIVDQDKGEIRYASAGHPPALLISADGEVTWLDQGHSRPLTGEATRRGIEGRIDYTPGSVVVLYTDGLVERRGEPLEKGLGRLADLAPQVIHEDPAAICDHLVNRLSHRAGRDDDIVIMTMKFQPETGPAFHQVFPANPEELRRVRSSIRSWMEGRKLPDSVRDDLLISVGEASANVVRHAYGESSIGEFEVQVRVLVDALDVEVSDHGTWREPSGEPPTPGLGLDLIRSMSDRFRIRETATGTLVSFRIPVESSASAAPDSP